MVKTRVHDLAAEFGVPAEQLMSLLRDMHIFARSHMSALEDAQVSAVRVRWEREKRKAAQATDEPAPKKRAKKAAKPAAEPEAPAEAGKPAKRRRTAAEVQQAEEKAEAERAAEVLRQEALELTRPVEKREEPMLPASIEERARALFKDLPPLPVEEPAAPEAPASPFREEPRERATPEPVAEAAPATPAVPPVRPPLPPASAGGTGLPRIPTRIPRPVAPPGGEVPRFQRPKPVFSSSTPGGGQGTRPGGPRPGGPRPGGPGGPRPGGPGGRPGQAGPGPSGGAVTGERPRNFGPDAQKGGARKKKKGRKTGVDQDAVLANIEKTLAGMHRGTAKRTGRRDDGGYREQLLRQKEEREREKTRIRVNEFISVSELADLMKVPASQIVQLAFKGLGLMVTVNQRLDFDQIELISSEFGFEAVKEEEYAAPEDSAQVVEEDDAQQVARPPVVTIMGHVDHGKTSLLDYIRKANVVAGEAGGITQHIGAYHVTLPDGRKITFLDTPGHQAFTAMRARGAQVTDIVVLVVSAEDAVMPQTVEAISHAKNAGVPMIVAINKIDLPAANVQKVKQDLLSHSVVLEEFGGQVLSTAISAKKGTNVEKLLEQILLQAEILDLKANPERSATGTVVEATLDPGKGPVATILVQKGTLHVGDNFICGKFSGRVRALYDERGKNTKVAGPSIPVQILGFEGTPSPGDNFLVTTDAVEAREIAQKRQRLEREAQNRRTARGGSLEDISRALAQGQMGALRLIIKADQGGPAEALADALGQLSTGEVRVDIVHRGVGSISESDVLLAKASGAIIIGFHVRPDGGARAAAEREQVDVRTYRIIYEAVDDVRNALEGLLKPESRETVLGDAEVMQLFKVSKVGTIAGCQVRHGTIVRTAKVRVLRDGVQVYDGMLSSLKRFKDDVREVKEGLECGIGVENFNDVKVGDMIEAYRVEEIKRTLAGSGSGAA
ncbi:MAG: translation initiation factor IF-2 [Gemmatimonadetes bacterium]|nr:translation initiation factor IF-2 [Gemmatimonadota bacterium]